MIEVGALTVLALVLLGGPALGVYMMYREIVESRITGRELDALTGRLLDWLGSLTFTNDLADSYVVLANWLEEFIEGLETPWLRMCTRLLIELERIGFGEESRPMLVEDSHYRYRALKRSLQLAAAIEEGRTEPIMQRMAELAALFIAYDRQQSSLRSSESFNLESDFVQPLQEIAKTVHVNPVQAEATVGTELRRLASYGDIPETTVPLLVLKWLQIRLKSVHSESYQGSVPSSKILEGLSRELVHVSKAIPSGNLARVTEIVYGGL